MATRSGARPFWIVDCETDPFKYGRVPVPFIWGVYTGTDYFEFDTPESLVEFLRDKEVVVYAHNGGKFDYHYLTKFMSAGPVLIIAGRLSKFKIGLCEFRDSYNIIPIGLAKFFKTTIDYEKFEAPVRNKNMAEIRSYLKDDCLFLYELVKRFRNEYGAHLTQASAAMRIWSKVSGRPAPCCNPNFYDEFHRYYYGGRVQCFQGGDLRGNFKSYDINSAYPYAMLAKHPISIEGGQVNGWPKNKEIGPCFFKIKCLSEGAFPFRATDGSLFFPDWQIEGPIHRTYYITGWELLAAIETKTVKDLDVQLCSWFDDLTDFREYMEKFWKLREESNRILKSDPTNMDAKAQSNFAKLFMVSLYGKFAADPRKYESTEYHPGFEDYSDYIASGISTTEYDYGFFSHVKNLEGKMRFYNVATSASITGFVRAYLWRHILKTTRPLYCDTDSITASDFNGFSMGHELGEWKQEGTYDRVCIGGKKLYAMHKKGKLNTEADWKIASKGIRADHQMVIDVCAGNEVEYLPKVPTYSVLRAEPLFIPRVVRRTDRDVREVPPELDPQLSPDYVNKAVA